MKKRKLGESMAYEMDLINKRLNQIRKIKERYKNDNDVLTILDNLEEIYLLVLKLYKKK